jgi:hypothetical protein
LWGILYLGLMAGIYILHVTVLFTVCIATIIVAEYNTVCYINMHVVMFDLLPIAEEHH